MTIFSPHTVGSVADAKVDLAAFVDAPTGGRPAGLRFSAMSIDDMIFRREMMPSWIARSAFCISCSTPSMRNRTVSCCLAGLDVDVARAVVDGLRDQQVHEADDRARRCPAPRASRSSTTGSTRPISSIVDESSLSSSSERRNRSNICASASWATTTGSTNRSVTLATSSSATMSVGSRMPTVSRSPRRSIGISWYLRQRLPGHERDRRSGRAACSTGRRSGARCAARWPRRPGPRSPIWSSRAAARSSGPSPTSASAADISAARTAPVSTSVCASPRMVISPNPQVPHHLRSRAAIRRAQVPEPALRAAG